MKIIGLSGYARSGKDTVAAILCENGWKRHAFADKLKEAVRRLNPIVDTIPVAVHLDDAVAIWGPDRIKEEYPEYRRLLQIMGTEVGRNMFGEDFWVEQALREVAADEWAVFTDCRFPNEARAIKSLGGEVWRIRRPGYGPVNGHASETSLDDWDFDRIIENDGSLSDLKAQAMDDLVNRALNV